MIQDLKTLCKLLNINVRIQNTQTSFLELLGKFISKLTLLEYLRKNVIFTITQNNTVLLTLHCYGSACNRSAKQHIYLLVFEHTISHKGHSPFSFKFAMKDI